MRRLTTITSALSAALFWLSAVPAQAQICETFEDGIDGFQFCQDYGGRGTGTMSSVTEGGRTFIRAEDGPHGNHLCTTANSPLLGDWFAASDCTEICMDVFRNDEGDSPVNVGALTPRIWVFNGSDWALFTWNQTVTVPDGWNTFCAPVKKLDPGEAYPTSADGAWTTSFGTDQTRWNTLFSSVTRVRLPLDTNYNVKEDVSYDNICLSGVNCPGTPREEATIDKTCGMPLKVGSAGNPQYAVSCEIAVVPSSAPKPGSFLFIEEELRAPDGSVNGAAIDALTASGWDCVPASGPYAQGHVPQCFIAEAALPATGVTIPVDMTLFHDNEADWRNCARLARIGFDPNAMPLDPYDVHAAYGADDIGPFAEDLAESCVDIPVRHPEDPPPPEGATCSPFTPEVTCDQATGTWNVSLRNALTGTFDPSDIKVSTQAQGITLIPGSDPLNFRLGGAQPGDVVTISTEALAEGAGSGEGLDLCCTGEIEVVIPEGEVCEPPEPDRYLDVHKTCEPLEGTGDGSNYQCTFTVTYSGPPPTPANPITVTDTLVSGGPMVLTSFDPGDGSDPADFGDDQQWSCSDATLFPSAGPMTCQIDNQLLPGKPAGFWQNYTSTFALWMQIDEPFANCGDAAVNHQSGLPIEAQSCYSVGDWDLEIIKNLADDTQACVAGQPCRFIVDVINVGTAPYSGPVTIFDQHTLAGQSPGGTITGILPAVCDPADLGGAGCNDTVTLNPGDAFGYEVTFVPAPGLTGEGQNCAALSDPSLSPEDDPFTTEGHVSCVDFVIEDEVDEDPAELLVDKTCSAANPGEHLGIPGWIWQCQITVAASASGAPIPGVITLDDAFDFGSSQFGEITNVSAPNSDWSCAIAPGGLGASCTAPGSALPPGSSVVLDAAVFAADTGSEGVTDAQNCATVGSNTSCADLSAEGDDTPPPTADPLDLAIDKVVLDGAIDTAVFALQPTVVSGSLSVGDVIHVRDDFSSAGFGGVDVAPITSADGWVCTVSGLFMDCAFTVTDPAAPLPPVEVTGLPGAAPWTENCAFLEASNGTEALEEVTFANNRSCVAAPKDDLPLAAPRLELVKSAEGACSVNKSAQTYGCGFALTLRNTGEAAYEGPVVIDDRFGKPQPRSMRASGDDWSCHQAGEGASCILGGLRLEPGQESRVDMALTLPGLRRGGSFENCATTGVGEGRATQATVIQSAMQALGIDGGPVDGQPGRKTRAGVRELQERLGLPATGDIDETLFAALGVPMAGEADPSCVTVDLPPMPVVCKPGQEVNSKGECYFPACPRGQRRNSKGQCFTPPPDCKPWQELNSRGKCYTPACPEGQKRNSKGVCYTPDGPRCDPTSTVKRNGQCVCRYEGMRKTSATSCGCRNGLLVVRGAGCVRVKIEKGGGDGGPAGTSEKTCLVIAGVRVCR